MQDYMDEFAPESDLIADVDAVAVSSSSAFVGFLFDHSRPLSDNLDRFYFPTSAHEGKNRRFHIFCGVQGLSLKLDGITLSPTAIADIDNNVHAFADWFSKNDPGILKWVTINGGSLGGFSYNPIWSRWIKRAKDWQWFAQKFRDFVERNLSAEGP